MMKFDRFSGKKISRTCKILLVKVEVNSATEGDNISQDQSWNVSHLPNASTPDWGKRRTRRFVTLELAEGFPILGYHKTTL